MENENRADQIVRNLKIILGISDSAGTEDFERALVKSYVAPINTPLYELKKRMGAACDSINIDESAASSICKKTLVMRQELADLLLKCKSDDEKKIIAKWIVEVWGGIPSGKNDDSLNECISHADETVRRGDERFDFKRIASWSKYLAFKDPKKYAIYDARVIYSLNWLLFQSGSPSYFPFLSGRNSVMELLNYQLYLFLGNDGSHVTEVQAALENDIQKRRGVKPLDLMNPESNTKSFFSNGLKKRRSLFVSDKDAFSQYCELLQKISIRLFSAGDRERLTKTEMLLFSIADAEIADAILKHIATLVVAKSSITE